MQLNSQSMLLATKIYDSPLSKEILKCVLLRKFSTPTFDYYSEVSDSVQHIRHFQYKMVLYSGKDPIVCLTFSSSLALDWFYSVIPKFDNTCIISILCLLLQLKIVSICLTYLMLADQIVYEKLYLSYCFLI